MVFLNFFIFFCDGQSNFWRPIVLPSNSMHAPQWFTTHINVFKNSYKAYYEHRFKRISNAKTFPFKILLKNKFFTTPKKIFFIFLNDRLHDLCSPFFAQRTVIKLFLRVQICGCRQKPFYRYQVLLLSKPPTHHSQSNREIQSKITIQHICAPFHIIKHNSLIR